MEKPKAIRHYEEVRDEFAGVSDTHDDFDDDNDDTDDDIVDDIDNDTEEETSG
jgi:hypothetical protein